MSRNPNKGTLLNLKIRLKIKKIILSNLATILAKVFFYLPVTLKIKN